MSFFLNLRSKKIVKKNTHHALKFSHVNIDSLPKVNEIFGHFVQFKWTNKIRFKKILR